jgi:hypothetical protein
MTEPAAKFSGEMSRVVEAAIAGDLAYRLACVQQRPALQETCGVIQTNRMKYGVVTLHIIEASIPLRPPDAESVATNTKSLNA